MRQTINLLWIMNYELWRFPPMNRTFLLYSAMPLVLKPVFLYKWDNIYLTQLCPVYRRLSRVTPAQINLSKLKPVVFVSLFSCQGTHRLDWLNLDQFINVWFYITTKSRRGLHFHTSFYAEMKMKKKMKLHYVNPKRKFILILSPQEQRQGTSI